MSKTHVLIAKLVENKIESTFVGMATEYLLHRDVANGCRATIVDLRSGEEMDVDIPNSSPTHHFQKIEDIGADGRVAVDLLDASER